DRVRIVGVGVLMDPTQRAPTEDVVVAPFAQHQRRQLHGRPSSSGNGLASGFLRRVPPSWTSSSPESRALAATRRRRPRSDNVGPMDFVAFQQLMESTYGANDRRRGVPATVAWLAEEI